LNKTVHYRSLRQLMAKHGLNKGDIASIIGKSYRQTLKKMNKEKSKSGKIAKFDIDEAEKVVRFFQAKDEKVTVDYIFFDQPFSNEN
jgi:DNA-binding XRE family transcriptional regulator